MKTIVLATNNLHKASEISHALDFPEWEFKTLQDMGIDSNPIEDADTFVGNARIKAHAAQQASGGMAVLADDSGLMVDALCGAPGVNSARYAAVDETANADDAANNLKLLENMKDVADADRTARFVCTLVYLDDDGTELVAEGTVEGRIGHEPHGTAGFGYDPLFLPDVFQGSCTMAEVPQARKNEVSHRGAALRNLRDQLEARMG